jgi:hypothetical protein
MCLVVWFLHPFVWGARGHRWLCWSRAGRTFTRAGQVAPRWGRNVRNFPVSGFPFRKMMWVWRPLAARRRTVPCTPLLLLKVLVLPSVPASTVLRALALVHGERVDVIHHASITVRASHIHSPSQHCRSYETHSTLGSDCD